jgi:hypothetical protein
LPASIATALEEPPKTILAPSIYEIGRKK